MLTLAKDLSTTISIHAPTRGATKTTGAGRPETTNFNPRSHEGSDHVGGANNRLDSKISIHAPTRGATPGSQT